MAEVRFKRCRECGGEAPLGTAVAHFRDCGTAAKEARERGRFELEAMRSRNRVDFGRRDG